jgi:HAMP domain-containing protein
MRRKRYIINWRFQIKYALWIIMPIIVLGLFSIIVGFRIGSQMVDNQKQQLMLQISTLEQSLRDLRAGVPDRITIHRIITNIKNLKILSQDLVAINTLELGRLSRMMVAVIVVIVVGAMVLGVFLTHRIAGPMFHLRRCIREMIRDVTDLPIKVRVTDEFKELAASLEELRRALRFNTSLRKEVIINLVQLIDKMNKDIAQTQIDKQDLERLKVEIARLDKIC